METYEIQKDLKKVLENLDRKDYVLASCIAHLETQCTKEEIKLIEEQVLELEVKEYIIREDFLEDYQPIFDTVDFPFKECFRVMDKRTLNINEL